MGLEGVKDAYTKGRGAFKIRGKVAVEPLGPRRTGLVVTELPYQVGPERVIEKIKDAVQSKKLTGISDVTDLTDRNHGLRLVIGIKTGFDPQAVLDQLYRLTPLEDSFSINNVALVDGQPQTLGLKELLSVYLDHRFQVVTRRSRFRLARREERLHLVQGLLIAILDIDEVIQVIRTSDDSEQARTRLREVFDLSEVQAEYILELRLRRLTKFSRIELESERDALLAEIAALRELLASECLIRAQVARELEAASDLYGTPRRTMLHEREAGAAAPDPRGAGAGSADRGCADGRRALHDRPCGARRSHRRPGADGPRAPQQARCDPRDGVLDDPRRTRRPHDLRPRDPLQPGRPAVRAARVGAARGRRRAARLPRHHRQEGAGPRARHASTTTPRSPSARARASSSASCPRRSPFARRRGHRPQARRRARRRRLGTRRRRTRVRHERRPAAALLGRGRAPAGRARRRHGGHATCSPKASVVFFGAVTGHGCGGDQHLRSRGRDSGNGCRPDQGLEVRGVPAEGPCDRRRARARVPQGRGPPHARVGRARARAGRRTRRLGAHAAGGDREARCLGSAARCRHRVDRPHAASDRASRAGSERARVRRRWPRARAGRTNRR